MIPNHQGDNTRNNYNSISLINIEATILNKILSNQSRSILSNILWPSSFYPNVVWIVQHYCNELHWQIKRERPIGGETAVSKIQYPFISTGKKSLRLKGNYLHLMKLFDTQSTGL